MDSPGQAGEFDLIARYFAPLSARQPLAFGLTDDAALLRPASGCDLVATMDCMVAGVHFFPDDAPADIAAKLLRVNLSDLAAMGARPSGYLLSCAWPRGIAEAWIAAFAGGLGADQERYGTSLVGGDTVATDGPLTFSLTALGEVERGTALRRAGARVGDAVYVSGTIGDAGLGLMLCRGEVAAPEPGQAASLLARLRRPEPRLALGRALRGLASAAIDVSDGLLADLGHVCECSGTGAEVQLAAVPLSDAARQVAAARPDLLAGLLSAGDDYELCFSVPPGQERRLQMAAEAGGTPVSRIGRIVEGSGVRLVDGTGGVVEAGRGGYRHF